MNTIFVAHIEKNPIIYVLEDKVVIEVLTLELNSQ